MRDDNMVIRGTMGTMLVVGGSLWVITQAIIGKFSYLSFIVAGMFVVIGILLFASALKGEKWIAL